jgi:hypothetical protein
MSLWSKIVGTIETTFQIGLGGPKIKNNSSVLEARNAADSGYVVVRGATPVGDSDLTTKLFVDTVATPTIVTAQHNGGVALPANTGVRHFYVVSTTGAFATIGNLLFDDGSAVGDVTVITTAARMIVTTAALSGGTVTFKADSPYVWDTDGVAWVAAGPSGVSGAIREIRLTITNAATQDSVAMIPSFAKVTEATLNIVTPYSGGATITVGRVGSLTLLQDTTDNLATVAGLYQVMQDTDWGVTELVVRVTVAGAPAAGAGYCIVKYTLPDT